MIDLEAIRARDARAPDYGQSASIDDEGRTSHDMVNAFRDRRALLAAYDALTAENAALRELIGRDVRDFDYPPGSAPCMCYFSTAEDRGADPLGECDYHAGLRKRLAEAEATSLARYASLFAAEAQLGEAKKLLDSVMEECCCCLTEALCQHIEAFLAAGKADSVEAGRGE